MSSTFALARPKVPSWWVVSGNSAKKAIEHSYLLLGELTGTLVLAVAEKFDDAALIGSKAIASSLVTLQFTHEMV